MNFAEGNEAESALASVRLLIFDFDGVFTDNTVYVNQSGIESVRCWRSDGLGLTRVAGIGIPSVIISTERNPVVRARANKLRLPVKDSVEDKAEAILKTCEQFGVPASQTIFVGNDINDIAAFKVVGLPVAVADACPEVLTFVKLQTKRPGGFGAVREVCDWVYNSKIARAAEQSREIK
jgi:3-deoxy-D-manno-octulosonate 8-phosphate phosphatase (KDO 8-P phosphatase)